MTDLTIAGGDVIDGTGAPRRRADVTVCDGRIGDVGELGRVSAARTIDATGLVVCPGFIDIHCHPDIALLNDPPHAPTVMQGVTTEVFTCCGVGFAPITDDGLRRMRETHGVVFGDASNVDWNWRSVAELLARYDQGVAVNVAYCVPHGALRASVVGMDDRPATPDEIRRMGAMLRQGMEQGARGFSTGPWYTGMTGATTDELVALCRVVAEYGGMFSIHLREARFGMYESVLEAVDVAERAGLPVQISHYILMDNSRGRPEAMLGAIDQARARGVDVTIDSYPYTAGCTSLHALLPKWATEGAADEAIQRLARPETRARIKADMSDDDAVWAITAVSDTQLPEHASMHGRRVTELAAERGQTPVDFVCDLVVAERLQVAMIFHGGCEEDVQQVMQHPWHMVGSDGVHLGRRPHPRLYGTFPRYLGHYARDLGVLRLEQAVRKMTGLPAWRMGLTDRGTVAPGMAADLVLFDPTRVRDRATFDDPCQFPDGIPYVIINGRVVKDNETHTGQLAGQVLRRT